MCWRQFARARKGNGGVLQEIDGRFAELMAVRGMILLNVAAFVETKRIFFLSSPPGYKSIMAVCVLKSLSAARYT